MHTSAVYSRYTSRGETYGRARNIIRTERSTAAELRVAGVDSGIDNIDGCSTSSSRIVDIGGGILVSVGDTTKAICCPGLGGESIGIYFAVLLDVGDLQVE